MGKINIRNLYIDLLNKIKQSEGVSKDYVDGQVAVIDQHLTSIDGDITAINSVIPETASATNQLITGDDITGSETFGPSSSITIEDSEAFNLAACEVNIEPIQDLHGYNYPWVSGANKNKLWTGLSNIKSINTDGTWNDNVYSINGIAYTISTNSSGNVTKIVANGTATANATLNVNSNFDTTNYNGYIYSCLTQAGGSGKFRSAIQQNGSPYTELANDTGSGATITTPSSGTKAGRVWIAISSGRTVSNLEFYPMVRPSGTDSTFAPYTNICPITGTSSEVITVSDGDDTKNYTIDLDGTRYGGSLNVKTGVLTVNRGFSTFVGADSEGWASSTQYDEGRIFAIAGWSSANNAKSQGEAISNYLVKGTTSQSNNTFGIGSNLNVRVSQPDLASFKAFLASNNLQVCYELATPLTVQLTPVQIQLLTGNVTISASSGTITITTTKLTGAVEDLTALVDDILPKLPAPPTTDGSYNLTVTVTNDTLVYTWEATT